MEKTVATFSEKMKKLLKKKKITIKTLSEKTGYSEQYLSQIENNEIASPGSVIFCVAQALSVLSEELLFLKSEQNNRRKAINQRISSFEKRSEQYSYKVLTPLGKQKHLNAFKVTIDPTKDHKMVEYHIAGRNSFISCQVP